MAYSGNVMALWIVDSFFSFFFVKRIYVSRVFPDFGRWSCGFPDVAWIRLSTASGGVFFGSPAWLLLS
jgi:hypothetical protein